MEKTYQIFSVGLDRPEIIVASTEVEAVNDHLERAGAGFYGADEALEVSTISLDKTCKFEADDGNYNEMTFAEFLGKDYIYNGPHLICWVD
ncbi:hypothetical protein [Paenibacillus periandrae]|uniref:hypothetical protein n=1 Tax=Paenibacillus periandrae TaxID=1761741 RepID=UPI001F08C4BA|nr:hypothetical protein [Paenibacillus periandrae]